VGDKIILEATMYDDTYIVDKAWLYPGPEADHSDDHSDDHSEHSDDHADDGGDGHSDGGGGDGGHTD
jgi:hypothetical protein